MIYARAYARARWVGVLVRPIIPVRPLAYLREAFDLPTGDSPRRSRRGAYELSTLHSRVESRSTEARPVAAILRALLGGRRGYAGVGARRRGGGSVLPMGRRLDGARSGSVRPEPGDLPVLVQIRL